MPDKHIGKVILVELPNNSRPRYRQIVKKIDIYNIKYIFYIIIKV